MAGTKGMAVNMNLRGIFCGAAGAVGSVFSYLLGGWDAAMAALLIFMGIDYVTGLMVAGLFHKSPKSENGKLESGAGWKGLCRKGVTLLIVLVAVRLDRLLGTVFIRDGVIIGYMANEVLSIIENAGLMGVPVPEAICRAIEVLQKK